MIQRFHTPCLARLTPTQAFQTCIAPRTVRPAFPASHNHNLQVRSASGGKSARKAKTAKPKKKKRSTLLVPNLTKLPRFSLVEAMRYIQAAEVGQQPTSAKYELHIRFRTKKEGPVVRGQIRLPHALDSSTRICVIVAPGSREAEQAISAGATLVGEETVFDAIREGRIEFDRCICHRDSLEKLSKANLGRILGPRGLMPSSKMGTVVSSVASAVRDVIGGTVYRERMGVVRLAVGQLAFTPKELQTNIQQFMEKLKKDLAAMNDQISKEIHEVVLSSTRGPGLSLDGSFRGAETLDVADLSIRG